MEDVSSMIVQSNFLSLVNPLLCAICREVDGLQMVNIDGRRNEGLGVFLRGVQEEWGVSLMQSKGVTVNLGLDRFIKEENVCRG